MDVLSEVLRVVQLNAAVFYNAEFSQPWCFRSPASRVIGPHLGLEAGHVIMYHLLTEGEAWVRLLDGENVNLGPGDIVVFPHGDPHLMGSGPPVEPRDNEKEIKSILAQGLSPAQMGGGGQITKFVCGYMACEPQLSQILLAGLPPLLTVNIRNDPAGLWVENSIQFSVAKANSSDPGAEALLAKLSEALFIETLRRYVAQLPPGQTGWFAGARDPEVGKALALLHAQPARAWTIADLATAVGSSRSVLAQRFRHYLGEPPIGYLTRWRLQLGSRMLSTTSRSVAEIAAQVGYDSESAFNRAFKRGFGVPPAQFRKHSKANAGSATA